MVRVWGARMRVPRLRDLPRSPWIRGGERRSKRSPLTHFGLKKINKNWIASRSSRTRVSFNLRNWIIRQILKRWRHRRWVRLALLGIRGRPGNRGIWPRSRSRIIWIAKLQSYRNLLKLRVNSKLKKFSPSQAPPPSPWSAANQRWATS